MTTDKSMTSSDLEQPLVSVGLSVYDRPKLLRQALECLTKQSYRNLEIVISDDCSPGEETKRVVHEFMEEDPRIQYYCQEKNLGAYLNRVFVFEKATGEYFFWASEDDLWDRRFVEACVEKLDNNKRYGIVFTRYRVISHNDEINFRLNHNLYLTSKYRKPSFLLLDECLTHKANMMHGVWRRETLERVMKRALSCGLTQEHQGKGFDQAFLLLTLDETSIYQVQEVLFTKRYMDSIIPGSRRALLRNALRNLKSAVRHPVSYCKRASVRLSRYMEITKRAYGEDDTISVRLIFFAKGIQHIILRYVF